MNPYPNSPLPGNPTQHPQAIPPLLQSEQYLQQIAKQVLLLLPEEMARDLPSRLQEQLANATRDLTEQSERARIAANRLQEMLVKSTSVADQSEIEFREARQSLQSLAADHRALIGKDLEEHRSFVTERREQFVKELLHEVAGIDEQKKLWHSQETHHWTWVLGTSILIAAALSFLFCIAYAEAPRLQIDLDHIGSAVSVIGCGLVGAWAVGILSRLLMSSLIALKDSRHRLAVIETFVGMRFRRQLDEEDASRLFAFLLTPCPTGLLKGAEMHPVIEAVLAVAKQKKDEVVRSGPDLM
jgi:hypothetical protein